MSLFDQISQQHYAEPPAGWQTKKIKFLAGIQTSNVDKLTVDDEEPVRLCNYTDVYYNDRITPDLPFMEATATVKEIEKFTLQAGQVFITKDSEGWDDIGIPALVTEDMPGVLCGYHLAIFTPDREKLDGAFLAWLCRADALNDQFKLSANGVTRFGLGQYPMKNAVVGYPPLETQKRIAVFLDEKTAQIDGLIAKKKALLERLAEKRQAIITQAVTKGLNPAAPMKDSGIDWFGQIPVHWEVQPFKRAVFYQEGPGIMAADFRDEGVPLLRVASVGGRWATLNGANFLEPDMVAKKWDHFLTQEGDLLISASATSGIVSEVGKETVGCVPYTGIIRLNPIEGESVASFIRHFAVSESFVAQIDQLKAGSTIQHFGPYHLGLMTMAVPPVDEQIAIGAYLDRTLSECLTAEIGIDRSIAKLSEYRSALITAAVTGQIEGLQ